ncbi:ROK family protein [Bacteroides thetaiotaomicron]|uniref:ROK family protein n=1 Tax=Bacteroides thetaiotaomicron TaxID=818 RepID=UPI0021D42C0A|nr:ROK family protein [Bacteroides thetaiotaomicron]
MCKGEKDIIFVNVSWGVGIGIIIDGKVYTGKSGFSESSVTSMHTTMNHLPLRQKRVSGNRSIRLCLHRILLERIKKRRKLYSFHPNIR